MPGRRAFGALLVACAAAVSLPGRSDAAADTAVGPSRGGFSYGARGLQYDSANGATSLWFGIRLQSRYSDLSIDVDDAPDDPPDFEELTLRRGRLKLGGHLLSPELAVYSEYDFTKDQLLDVRVTYRFSEALSLRVGQWKSPYNRERVDSSGAQQFVERSIATPWFTIDRQQGIVASGRLGSGTAYDTSYWAGWLSGAGRGGSLDDADGLWLGRLQWNTNGRVLGFSQSDIGRRPAGAGSIAVAAVAGRSAFTRFSGAGGGQLPDYETGAPDQYRIRQFLVETAWQRRGFSWQQELHWKRITDTAVNREQRIIGGYAQAGMFFSELVDWVPEPLEFAFRYAAVSPAPGARDTRTEPIEREATLAANWFFNGHRNKLTLDLSRLRRQDRTAGETESRLRLQWDLSF